MSNFFRAFMLKLGVKMQPSTAYHPQWDGQTEVTNRTLNTYLSIFCQSHPKSWPDHLAVAEFEFNDSVKPTGFSPFYVNTGVNPRKLSDVLLPQISRVPAVQDMFMNYRDIALSAKQSLDRAFEKAAVQHNKHIRSLNMKVGDLVMLNTLHLSIPKPGGCSKFKQPFVGPFVILEVKSSGSAFRLQLPDSWKATRTWNGQYLKPFHPCSSAELICPYENVPVSDSVVVVPVVDDNASNNVPDLVEFENGPPCQWMFLSRMVRASMIELLIELLITGPHVAINWLDTCCPFKGMAVMSIFGLTL
jgi:hypothetical protein